MTVGEAFPSRWFVGRGLTLPRSRDALASVVEHVSEDSKVEVYQGGA